MPVVNGKKSEGVLFESGRKVYLIEQGEYRGAPYIEARELYDMDGQLGRTKSGCRVQLADSVAFIKDWIKVLGLPLDVVPTDD